MVIWIALALLAWSLLPLPGAVFVGRLFKGN